ncbi:MAG: helix-turn-helix transcriptional regulator [Clostridia bacterium]|nr:helix-turn-helix transcriptional regulator [Clostridia bacterium]
MFIKAAWYYGPSIESVGDRDLPPKGYNLFVLSAGHTKPITKECLETMHPPRRDYQLIYMQHGSLHYFDKDGTEHIAPEGSFVLYKPLEYQKYNLYLSEEADIYWCHFTGIFAETLLKDCNIFEKRVIILTPQVEYRRIYTRMRKALENRPRHFAELCNLYLKELVTTISSAMDDETPSADLPESLKIALAYIEEHYFEKIKINDLSKIAMVNKITLTRQFDKYINLPPKKYLNKRRISKAKNLLLQTDYRVGEIANAVGFQDPLYFSTAFHTEVGMSPSEYREHSK